MTDTITRDVITGTIDALTTARDRAITRLADEEAAYNNKRDRMVATAHARGTNNSIGRALDDLLIEFGLPGRGEEGYFRALVRITGRSSEEYVTLPGGATVYGERRAGAPLSVQWVLGAEVRTNALSTHTCLCDSAAMRVQEWIVTYYGAAGSRDIESFQIGDMSCSLTSCTHERDRRFRTTSDPARPWHEVEIHPFRPVPERT